MSAQAPDSPAASTATPRVDALIAYWGDMPQSGAWFALVGMARCLEMELVAAAPLPAAPAPTEQAMTHLANIIDFLGTYHPCAKMAENARAALAARQAPTDLPPMPTYSLASILEEAASNPRYPWADYSRWMKEASGALHAVTKWCEGRAARQVVAPEAAKEQPICWIDPIELRELENGVAMVTPDEGNAQRIPLFRQAPARPVVDGAAQEQGFVPPPMRGTDSQHMRISAGDDDPPQNTLIDPEPVYKVMGEARLALCVVNSLASQQAIRNIDAILNQVPVKQGGKVE